MLDHWDTNRQDSYEAPVAPTCSSAPEALAVADFL
jgi:hypothetical protein